MNEVPWRGMIRDASRACEPRMDLFRQAGQPRPGRGSWDSHVIHGSPAELAFTTYAIAMRRPWGAITEEFGNASPLWVGREPLLGLDWIRRAT